MRKAFIMAGSAFMLAMIMISSAGYVAYSKRILEKSVYERMVIDKVNSRSVDVYRIIMDASMNYFADNASATCSDLNRTGLLKSIIQIQDISGRDGLNFNVTFMNVSKGSGLPPCVVNVNYSMSLNKSYITQTIDYQSDYYKEVYFSMSCSAAGCA